MIQASVELNYSGITTEDKQELKLNYSRITDDKLLLRLLNHACSR